MLTVVLERKKSLRAGESRSIDLNGDVIHNAKNGFIGYCCGIDGGVREFGL